MQVEKRKGGSRAEISLKVVRNSSASAALVGDVMTKKVTTARPDMSLSVAIEALVGQDIGHLPVVDDKGVLVGILSKSDVVRDQHLNGVTQEEPSPGDRLKARGKKGIAFEPANVFHLDLDQTATVADLMSTKVLTVRNDESVAAACLLMVSHRIHGVPVVDLKKKLVGFLSSLDVCEWVAKR